MNAGQFQILEGIATGVPLPETLDRLIRLTEEVLPGGLCSILLLDESGEHLWTVASPGLPESYSSTINGTKIGPDVGSCGTAAYLGEPVIVENIETDPRWQDYKASALLHGLRACWSMPILAREQDGPQRNRSVLGTFAVYLKEAGLPQKKFLDWMERAQHLASIALETERATKKLRESETRFRTFVDHASDFMFLYNQSGTVLDVNQSAIEGLQYDSEELIGSTSESFDLNFAEHESSGLFESVKSGQEITFETVFRRRDGSTFPVEVRLNPFRSGERLLALALARDISERRQSEAAMERQRVLLQTTQELANLGHFELDLKTSRLTWSDMLYRIFGLDPESFNLSFDSFLSRVHPDDRNQLRATIDKALAEKRAFTKQERIIRPDGSVRHLESFCKIEVDDDGHPTHVVGACLDVTERNEYEIRLREGREALRRAHQIAKLKSWTFDVENERFCAPEGFEADDRLASGDLTIEGATEIVFPEDRERLQRVWDKAISSGESFDVEHRVNRPAGAEWVRTSAGVLFDDRGQVRQISGVTQDVSERHELEKQLRESQKMEALGRLAGGVAHDFNNLMTIVSGYAQLLEVSAWDEELLVEGVEAIKNAAEKAAGLTAQLLAFSRRSRAEPKVADLNQLVSRALKLLERLIRETVVVRVELERNECPVKIDLTHFQQIMMNLVVNANDAMPDGGELLVKVRTLDIASKELPDRHNLPPGPYVEMHVRDTGGGIHPELLPNIFEPFFTTKSVGQGTGLGLAVVHGVVKQWDGHIEVESSTNAGTSFRILFPRSSERVAAAPRGLVDRSVGSGETILVVEDEDAVRKLTCLSLERKGYKVLQAPLATTAIEIAEREHFDLLLTDVIMPGMDGQKLAEVLRERRECLPIIFMSGYTGDALVQAESEDAPQSFLQKPFTQRELLTLVRGLLDGKQTSDS